jgi:nucleoside phosphorylase
MLPEDSTVALAASGMGITNAAQKTEIVRRELPRAVLNYGCAGAHREDVLLGDVVIATRVVDYASEAGILFDCDPELLAAARDVAEQAAHELWLYLLAFGGAPRDLRATAAVGGLALGAVAFRFVSRALFQRVTLLLLASGGLVALAAALR